MEETNKYVNNTTHSSKAVIQGDRAGVRGKGVSRDGRGCAPARGGASAVRGETKRRDRQLRPLPDDDLQVASGGGAGGLRRVGLHQGWRPAPEADREAARADLWVDQR